MSLKTTVEACCGVSCADNIFNLAGTMTGRFDADIAMTGTINNAFQYCAGPNTGVVKITDPWGVVTTIDSSVDVINNVNNNVVYPIDFSVAPASALANLVVYNVRVEACLTTADGSVTCNINESALFQNTFFMQSYTKFSSASPGQVEIVIANPRANTTYVVYLKDSATGNILATHNTGLVTTVTTVNKTFTGLTAGTVVYCSVTATQNLYTVNCADTPTFTILP